MLNFELSLNLAWKHAVIDAFGSLLRRTKVLPSISHLVWVLVAELTVLALAEAIIWCAKFRLKRESP